MKPTTTNDNKYHFWVGKDENPDYSRILREAPSTVNMVLVLCHDAQHRRVFTRRPLPHLEGHIGQAIKQAKEYVTCQLH